MSEFGGPVAQRLEQLAHNQLVAGSNPAGPTILFSSNRQKRLKSKPDPRDRSGLDAPALYEEWRQDRYRRSAKDCGLEMAEALKKHATNYK
jgi:hypothetical protein